MIGHLGALTDTVLHRIHKFGMFLVHRTELTKGTDQQGCLKGITTPWCRFKSSVVLLFVVKLVEWK